MVPVAICIPSRLRTGTSVPPLLVVGVKVLSRSDQRSNNAQREPIPFILRHGPMPYVEKAL